MQKTANKAKSSSSYARPKLQKSATLSRKYVKKPVAKKAMDIKVAKKASAKAPVKTSAKVSKNAAFKVKAKASELKKAIPASSKSVPIKINKVKRSDSIKRFSDAKKKAVIKKAAVKEPVAKKIAAKKPVAKVRKPAIKPASADRAAADAARLAMKKVATMDAPAKPLKKRRGLRFFVALGCSAAAIAGLVTFVVVNMPNISVKVAAMQTGIDAEYPDFVPRGYSMETVAADKDNKITMKFVGPNEAYFVLTEENSTWDSAAVLNNYVRLNYTANYATMHEQGITYYSDSGSAVWVNGGILYKLTSFGKNLTREQIRNLVVSL